MLRRVLLVIMFVLIIVMLVQRAYSRGWQHGLQMGLEAGEFNPKIDVIFRRMEEPVHAFDEGAIWGA